MQLFLHFFPHNVAVSLVTYLGIMGKLFGNNGYLLAESENSIMEIKLEIIPWLSALIPALHHRPNHFICTSSSNATQCKTLHHIINQPLSPPTQNCSSSVGFFLSFFFSKPSTKMADVGKLLWEQTSYIVFVWVQVYLWLPENVVACEFHRHWGFVYIVECHFISLHLLRSRLH